MVEALTSSGNAALDDAGGLLAIGSEFFRSSS